MLRETAPARSQLSTVFSPPLARRMERRDPHQSARYRLLLMLASTGDLEVRDGLRYVRRADVLTTYDPDGAPLTSVTRTVHGIPSLCATIFTVGEDWYYLVDPLREELRGAEWWEVFYFKDHIRVHPMGRVVCRPEAFLMKGSLLRHRYGRGSVIAELSREEQAAALDIGVSVDTL